MLWKIIPKFRGTDWKKHDHHKILTLGVTKKFLVDDCKFL